MKVKKFLSALTAFALVCGAPVFSYERPLIEMQAAAADYTTEHNNLFWYYKYSDHIEICGAVDKTSFETFEIPSEIDQLPVTTIVGYRILTVDGVTYEPFSECTNLTSITIPNSVTTIGSSAFHKCTSLTSITIPESVTTIGSSAFNGCTVLTSVTIPESVTAVKENVFSGCTNLTSLVIKNPKCELSATMTGYVLPFTIYGYENSTAQAYALSKGMEFKLLDDAPADDNPTDIIEMKTGETKIVTGYSDAEWAVSNADILSISQDGTVTAKSAGTAFAYAIKDDSILKRFTISVTGDIISLADVNKDGKVNSSDASDILRYYAYTSTNGTLSFEEFMKK